MCFAALKKNLFMKKIVVFGALFLALSTSFYSANAQVNINVSIQPPWARLVMIMLNIIFSLTSGSITMFPNTGMFI